MSASGEHPFASLSPDRVLNAVEALGFTCDGRLLALNSYENRVYQVGIEESTPLVAKFYRPQRWPDEQILEEHAFASEMASAEIPVVAPLVVEGQSLHTLDGFRIALYPRVIGRAPEFESDDHLQWLGRLLARAHRIGEQQPFAARKELTAESFGYRALQDLESSGQIPEDVAGNYLGVARRAVQQAEAMIDQNGPYRRLRLHGDFHPGNILWGESGPLIVDLDDSCMGPAIQDLWMLLSGSRDERSGQLAAVMEGYSQFRFLDPAEFALIEPLRTLRIVHYAAWLAKRWHDPAFPAAFPWFASPRWWDEQMDTLNEQIDSMAQPPLDPERLN